MHRTPLSARLAWLLALALTVCLAPVAARAQVHDNAHLFSEQAISDADSAITQMQQRHGRGLVLETFAAVPDDQRAAVQQDKPKFFKHWVTERANATRTNGVYALICMDPKYLDVRAGPETRERGDFTDGDARSVSDRMKADLGSSRNDAALADAVDGVERAYTANITGGGGAPEPRYSNGGAAMPPVFPRSTPSMPSGSSGVGGLSIGGLVCVGIGLLIIFSLVRTVFGHRNSGGGGFGGGGFGGGGFGGGGTGFGGGGAPNYPTGGPAYGPGYQNAPPRTGGGFGTSLLGGLLGGAVGGYAADRFDHRNDPTPNAGFGGGVDPGAGGFGGGGGSPGFDPGPSDAGQFTDSGGGDAGGSFGGGGDSGGGGGGGGGDPGAGGF